MSPRVRPRHQRLYHIIEVAELCDTPGNRAHEVTETVVCRSRVQTVTIVCDAGRQVNVFHCSFSVQGEYESCFFLRRWLHCGSRSRSLI